jgi:DNA-binding winged helix-turn-helix (wHTH) protein
MGQVISFGPYRLDQTAARLLRGDTKVPLRLKTFAVLLYLATHPGRLITREELLDAVWPATHVTPSVLAGCIREIRRALGDDARCARFVETAHRRGYRFIAAVEPSSPLIEAAERILELSRDTELAARARRFVAEVTTFVEGRERARTADAKARHVVPGVVRTACRAHAKSGGRRPRSPTATHDR